MSDQNPTTSRDVVERMSRDARLVRYASLLPKEGPLMPQHHQEVRANYRKFAFRYDLTNADAAKKIGVSPSVLSQWLDDKYRGDNDGVADKVNRFLEREARAKDVRLALPYVPTKIAEHMRRMIGVAYEHQCMIAIVAPAGSGKSMVFEQCAQDSNGVYIYCDEDMTPKTLLEAIAKAIKVPTQKTIADLKTAVVEKLRGSSRTLFFDEAHLLRPQLFSRIRSIHDQAKVPVVFGGAAEILDRIDDRASGRGQLDSRCLKWNALDYFANVEDPNGGDKLGQPLFTREEIRKLFEHMPLKLTDGGWEMLWSIACLADRGCIRLAKRMVDMAWRSFGDVKSVGRDELVLTLKTFFGTRADVIVGSARKHSQAFKEAAAA